MNRLTAALRMLRSGVLLIAERIWRATARLLRALAQLVRAIAQLPRAIVHLLRAVRRIMQASEPRGFRRVYPMRDGTYFLSSPFGPRDGGFHYGQDFGADDGTPIYAAQAGTVVYIGYADGFGQWIVLDHDDTEGSGTTVYGHMWNAFATGLQQGDHVDAGQLIAYVGANGQSSGPHLHFEVHPTVWRAGSQIDPMPWLNGAGQP